MTLNPSISKKELAMEMNMTERTIDRDIKKLREEGFIKRIGPAKGGYWEIVQHTENVVANRPIKS